jgi:hypothetical protein
MKWHKQFSLLDLVWLLALCAVAAGWWADRLRFQRKFSDKWYDLQEQLGARDESTWRLLREAQEEIRSERRLKEYNRARVDDLEKEFGVEPIVPAEK